MYRSGSSWVALMMIRGWKGFAVAAVAVVLCHAGWAGEEVANSDEQALRKRVTTYWDARVERSESVYDFYPSPELGGPKNQGLIGESGNIFFESWRIEAIAVEGDSATVRLNVNVRVTPLQQGGAKAGSHEKLFTVETWNRICGTWYKKPVPRGLTKKEFDPSELGPVGEGGPDCAKVASNPKGGAGAVRAVAEEESGD
jgi:hypothetical protein